MNPESSASGEPPLFTIITVCRNAEAVISVSLESLAAQTFTDWEWIMVDGASTDATVSCARLLEGKGRRNTIISEPDSGIYHAMNKGLRAAQGRYVHFLNAGDTYHDERVLEAVATEMKRWPDTDFLYGNILVYSAVEPDFLFRPRPPETVLHEMVCGCLPHQGSFARLSLFIEKIGFFNEEFRTASDYQWMMRAVTSPDVRLHYFDRVIAKFSTDGYSSILENSLPESFKVLNENKGFQQAIGMSGLLAAYQDQVLALRIQLRDAVSGFALTRNKLTKVTTKLEELRAKLSKKKQPKRKSWLPKWLRF